MVTVATVNIRNYRGMGARYVNALYAACRRHITLPLRFVCFTDNPSGLAKGIDPISLPDDLVPSHLHGAYGKIAMFRPGAFDPGERVLYMDLDTIVLSNIDDIASYNGPFAMLQRPLNILRSGVMAWTFAPHLHDIWNKWVAEGHPSNRLADQGWIRSHVSPDPLRLQDVFPHRLLSFLNDCHNTKWKRVFPLPPRRAGIVYFHGSPK